MRLDSLPGGGYTVKEDSTAFGSRDFGVIEQTGISWRAYDSVGQNVGVWDSKQTAAMMAAQSSLRVGAAVGG